jgi:small subunit ribosomal protein S6
MLDPDLAEERQDEIILRTRELVEGGGGTWLGHDPWGRRRLAYPINKKSDGIYHLLQFDAEPETLDELTRILKITDGVMRHLPTRRLKGSHGPGRPGPEPVEPAAAAPAQPAGREPEYAGANVRSQPADGAPTLTSGDEEEEE